MLAYYYPPYLSAGASRAGQLAKYLVRAGLEVDVVTAHVRDLPLKCDIASNVPATYARNFELGALPARLLRRDLRESGYGFGRVGLGGLAGELYRQLVLFPDAQIGWVPGALRAAERLPCPDVVLSSLPPASAHLAAMIYSRRHDVPWVAEFRNPWVGNPTFRRWWPARILEARLEAAVFRSADAITTVAASFATELRSRLKREVVAIPNGYDPDDFASPAPAIRDGLLAHAGTIYENYDVPTFLAGLRMARKECMAMFSGRVVGQVRDQAAQLGVSARTSVVGPVLRSEALALMRSAQMNVLFLGRHGEDQVAQKLYEYLAAGRPILAIGEARGEGADILRRSGLGVFAETAEQVAAAIDRPHDLIATAEVEQYAYPVIAASFTEVLARAAHRHRSSSRTIAQIE